MHFVDVTTVVLSYLVSLKQQQLCKNRVETEKSQKVAVVWHFRIIEMLCCGEKEILSIALHMPVIKVNCKNRLIITQEMNHFVQSIKCSNIVQHKCKIGFTQIYKNKCKLSVKLVYAYQNISTYKYVIQ